MDDLRRWIPLRLWPVLWRHVQATIPGLRIATLSCAVFATFTFAGLLCIKSPIALAGALVAGMMVVCLGQRWRLKQIAGSNLPEKLADFHFDGVRIHCQFKAAEMDRFSTSWPWRIAAASSAGVACFALQSASLPEPSLIPLAILNLRWLHGVLIAASPGLPVLPACLFLRFAGPGHRWSAQIENTLQSRAAKALAGILNRGEIDGLEAGACILERQIGTYGVSPSNRSGPFREAIERWLRAHPAEAFLDPAKPRALLAATTELARLELTNLEAALSRHRTIEADLRAAQALALDARDPATRRCCEQLASDALQLPQLAKERNWADHTSCAEGLLVRIGEFCSWLSQSHQQPTLAVLTPGADPYALLGIHRDTPIPSVKKLRQRLAQVYHPDIGGETCNSAKMAELNAAYDAVMRERMLRG